MRRRIQKVAVLGSGVMGSGIACHFANVGLEVLLLDIVPRELTPAEKAKGMTLETKAVRNRIVNEALEKSLKTNPSPIYDKAFASRITTGNMDDDFAKIADCDWVIEVVVERLDIKKVVFEKVDKFRKKGTLVTSNTSGIPIRLMAEGRSEDFQKNFCGTHFFNPPRYLQLFEIIPAPNTDPEVLAFLEDYAGRFLGKKAVVCKDTPAFIANRVGTFSIMALFQGIRELGLTVEEVDKLTGPVLGRPKSATFRTADVVGLDTLVHVANGVRQNTSDESSEVFQIPDYLQTMLQNGWLGQKSGQGFYKKVKDDKGRSDILSLDLNTLEYVPQKKAKFATLDKTKAIDDLRKRMPVLMAGKDKAGEFYRANFYALFQFVSNRIPEISDELYKVDDALNAGFGWKLGPFETWDAVGVRATVAQMEAAGRKPAQWIYDMLEAGCETFYKAEGGRKFFYDIPAKAYAEIPGQEGKLSLALLKPEKVVWSNNDASIIDLGDGVLNVEFHSKMNTIGGGTLAAINKAIDMAEKDYVGLVISNEGDNFSAGANVGMIFMFAVEQEYDELAMAVKYFQNTTMRLRYSKVPVVVAPHGLTLGGGCEICLHADKVVAHAETYMGLVEFGVGVIPGGGGTKEFAVRLSDEMSKNDTRMNSFQDRYLSIGQAKVSTSAYEAFALGYLRKGIDEVVVNRADQLAYAKKQVLVMAEKGYTQPAKRKDIKVLGLEGLGLVHVGADSFAAGNFMSEHDKLIAEKLGYVMAGGDLSQPLTEVTEEYLLDLERKAFVELCATRKTLERMQSLITKGKILRN